MSINIGDKIRYAVTHEEGEGVAISNTCKIIYFRRLSFPKIPSGLGFASPARHYLGVDLFGRRWYAIALWCPHDASVQPMALLASNLSARRLGAAW